ncbi:hypothetical protein K7I13_11675 [Brucepastera parasyntrophica]|uniref:hypothetical protein n=1 Tax=Brucepastera parasyntrophica TaxID=2880008 RepID=UPI00210E1345|nr:hypothetical protein [Brucepastera parasyntrophica]ULQ59151.1 hypothetical protein K7I13_11675 [Brucepastera parasyntrophica]
MNNEQLSLGNLQKVDVLSLEHFQQTIPDWDTAKNRIFPFFEPVDTEAASRGDIVPLNFASPLSQLMSSSLKMSLALFYGGSVIPLSQALIQEWSINLATIRLAMDTNMAKLASSGRFQSHTRGDISYYSVHSGISPLNSILPFYTPFQETCAALFGSPFYFTVPERRTVILFDREGIMHYQKLFKDDIYLTYETSTHPLSTEIFEVSESGVLPVFR